MSIDNSSTGIAVSQLSFMKTHLYLRIGGFYVTFTPLVNVVIKFLDKIGVICGHHGMRFSMLTQCIINCQCSLGKRTNHEDRGLARSEALDLIRSIQFQLHN